MCIGQNVCKEVGTDSRKFDRECPLRPPQHLAVDRRLDAFISTVKLYAEGKAQIDDVAEVCQHDEFRDWYIEHGQISGCNRHRVLGRPGAAPVIGTLDPVRRVNANLENEILLRDHYHCRYCGCRLIDRDVWRTLNARDSRIKYLNQRAGATNADVTGLVFATWPYIDHGLPHNLGGRTEADNLVSSCFACNFGKQEFTCEQIGITNPMLRPPLADGWDGLRSLRRRL